MAIDKSGEFWHGTKATDISDYLNSMTVDGYRVDAVKPVSCPQCGNDIWKLEMDLEEGALQVHCQRCGHTRFLLDSEEMWEECEPEPMKCCCCPNDTFNLAVGLVHRPSGEVKWVYIGYRCTSCRVLGSFADWGINYGPTDQLEASISPQPSAVPVSGISALGAWWRKLWKH